MAKTRTSEGTGKIKFRFIEFEMDGTDASLEEGLKSISIALNRGMNPVPRLLRQPQSANGGEQSAAPDTTELDVEGDPVVPEEGDEASARARAARSPARPKRVTPRRVVPDFKLDDVEPTLKQFAEGKNAGSDLRKYLVIAYWAKEYKQMEELTPDHFYTAYKFMGWTTPKDPVQPIRDLVNPRNGKFSTSETVGNGRINHLGENAVNAMSK